MTEQYRRLKETLAEIFQLDQADLDFGIYRIMNQKRDEINDFLDKKLLNDVRDALAQSTSKDTATLKEELDNLIKTLKSVGVNPDDNDTVKDLKIQYQAAGSPEALINEVFSHLTSFFKRYYHQGDFISQRRYKKDVYAIPYEGEEVKLHWANHDQYYIKTGENFKNYSFNITDGLKVSFVLREASTDQNNNKTQQGKERRFKLVEEDIFSFENNVGEDLTASLANEAKHLKIWFTYEPEDKKVKQEDLRQDAAKTIKSLLPITFRTGLLAPKPTPSHKERTLLDKHLQDYMAKNTFDYFIHKDLGRFLSRELDFYIKNEVLEIDDLNLDSPTSFERQLCVVKALKSIARKLIALMAQLEDFQKKLWIKKKMVLQSDYCITLDRVPENMYSDILANKTQIQEWEKLFNISEIKKDKSEDLFSYEAISYADVFDSSGMLLTGKEDKGSAFLKANPFLVLDTQFFRREWKYQLLTSIPELNEQCDGLMINSENFQALNFLENRFESSIDLQFLDPPYNTGGDGFPYKDNYKSSSWITMMENRLNLSKKLLKQSGVSLTHIDEKEHINLSLLNTEVFGKENRASDIIWKNSSKNDEKYISTQHEYIIVSAVDKSSNLGEWKERKEGLEEIYQAFDKFKKIHGDNWEAIHEEALSFYNSFPDSNPIRDNKHYSWMDKKGVYFPADLSKPAKGYYYDIIHPETGKPCKKPAGGWRFIESTMSQKIDKELIHFGKDETTVPNNKTYLKDTEYQYVTSVKYKDGRVASNLLKNLFGDKVFDNPKDPEFSGKIVKAIFDIKSRILDYFAGSGTTGHSIISLNREDDGNRKYILVEMGEYFNSVTKPRIQKVIYSEDWKDGKPLSRKGSSHCFKYLRLESYEDTLNNLTLKRNPLQQSLLSTTQFGEEYLLHYMLEAETRDSLLNLDSFRKPFGYTLKVTENNELREQEVDLVETFNYLIGLVVQSMELIRETVLVQGHNLAGDKILVIWRDVDQMDNASLNEFFRKLDINTRDSEFKRIYVNGDNNLENLRTDDEQWKVVLIEEEFHSRMFEEC